MLLKNLMEDKQLNFDQPLLSVRRFTSGAVVENESKRKSDKSLPSTPRPPPYRSELKSGPVTNPGTVPFLWEKSPGKPKDETKLETQTVERSPTAPKLPPGRALRVHQQGPVKASANPSVNRNQVGSISRRAVNVPLLDEDIKNTGTPQDAKKEEESSSSGDDEEAYVDALDTLSRTESRTESLFLNCSVSGLSGLDDPDIKIPGNSSIDAQSRDFMMGRFLPAAKAMASETPLHAPRKPPIVREQPRQLKKVISGDKRPQLRYGPNFVPDYTQCHDSGDEESDDDRDEHQTFTAKVCGLLPCLGIKGSFCLLNPLPGMSMCTQATITPLSRTYAKSSSSGSCGELDSERYQPDMSRQRSVGGFQMIKPKVNRKEPKNDDNPINHWSHHGKREGISSYGRLEVGGISSEHNGSLKSYEQKAALGISGEVKNSKASGFESDKNALQSFEELLADQNRSKELDTGSPVVEKTLYVDTVHKVESLNSKSCSSNRKRQSDIKEKECGILTESIEQNSIIDSSLKDIEKLSTADKEAMSQPDIQKPVDFRASSMSDKVNRDMRTVTSKPFGQYEDLYKGAFNPASLKVPQEESTKTHQKPPLEVEKSERYSKFPIPPPLPKSPTDSWLGRTLHTMSAKNASVHPYPGYQMSKPKSSDPKWETIVKTTMKQRQHLRFSEEQLTPVPES